MQIVCIITPAPQSHANIYSRKKNGNQNNAVTFTDAYNTLLQCSDTCINLINDHDGFTIVGWYKRGVINAKSLMAHDKNTSGYVAPVEPDAQCNSGEISYHIVQIIPNNRDFLDHSTVLGAELSEIKFDVSTILTN